MQDPHDRQERHFPSSPYWSRNLKLFVMGWVVIFLVSVLVTFSQLALYILMAIVLSLVIRPLVDFVDERIVRLPRLVSTGLIYLLLLTALMAIPISAIPSLVRQVATFITNLPELMQRVIDNITLFLSEPIGILGGQFTIPVDELTVEQIQQLLTDIISLFGNSIASVSTVAGNVAVLTIGFISSTVFVLFVSFYITKDGAHLVDSMIDRAPDGYHRDLRYMADRITLIWGAFLRGQVTLMVVIGTTTFVIASILGLPNPVALGAIAGLMEIVPYFGPVLAAIPGGLIAWFQYDSSWLGSLMTPFWFTMVVLGAYWLIQQLENYVVVPRVMGHQLKLHPAVVFTATLAGWQLAGITGVFLASPIVATLRLFGTFIYGKLLDRTIVQIEPEAESAAPPILERARLQERLRPERPLQPSVALTHFTADQQGHEETTVEESPA